MSEELCKHCGRDITKCRMDARGLCVKDPRSSGKAVRRTKGEKSRDRKLGG